MSKNSFNNIAFQTTKSQGIGFNLVPQTSSFQSVFNVKPLDKTESEEIERLLIENIQENVDKEKHVSKDAEELKRITSEIKAIGKQGILLMGERVRRAREVLKQYKDGTFTKWLETAFGTRKTGYNILSYYELYIALPRDELREHLKKLPQRTAYILASRNGNIETKAEIIDQHHGKPHEELVVVIQERLPVSSGDKRTIKSPGKKLISIANEALCKLSKYKNSLSIEDKKELDKLSKAIVSLITV